MYVCHNWIVQSKTLRQYVLDRDIAMIESDLQTNLGLSAVATYTQLQDYIETCSVNARNPINKLKTKKESTSQGLAVLCVV